MRLGYEITMSPSRVSSGTSSVTLRLRLYVWTRRSVYDSTNNWALSGNWSGSGSVNISHGSAASWSTSNRTLIATRTITVSPLYGGTQRRTFSASLNGINAVPGTARVSGSFTVPRRPVSAPAAPTNLRVTRNSDGSQSLNWNNTSPGSGARPYDRIQIRRWDTANNTYRTIATVSTRTSYTDRTTTSNQRYRYAVRANNAAGYSGFAYSDYIATTPAAPTNIRATKNNAGDITVRWSLSGIRYHTGVEIWARADGTNQSTRIGYRGPGQTSWTHTNPDPSVTWAYRVRVLADNRNGTYSSWSPTVQLLTNPLAPTRLSPTGVARDGREPITLTWQHNEVDGTDQTGYEIAHRERGTTTWTYSGRFDSEQSSHVLPAETYDNGITVEWRARTWGLYEGASPYSNSAYITLSTPPEATILDPEPGSTVAWSSTGVEWAYFDEDNDRQTQWRAELLDSTGDVLETRSGAGDTTSTSFTTVLRDNAEYTIRVQLRDAPGLWSQPDTSTFLVHYPTPPKPVVTGYWDHDTGSVTIEIDNPVPSETEDEVEPVYNDLWRSVNGVQWALIAARVPLETAITDYIPAVGTVNYYRAIAVSELPSQSESDPATVDTTDTRYWVWVNAGPGFIQGVRVRDNAQVDIDQGRAKELHRFAGRFKPVEFAGCQRSITVGLSARLAPESSTRDDIFEIADLPAPACLRLPDGTRYFVSTGEPSMNTSGVTTELSWSFTEIDHYEITEDAPVGGDTE